MPLRTNISTSKTQHKAGNACINWMWQLDFKNGKRRRNYFGSTISAWFFWWNSCQAAPIHLHAQGWQRSRTAFSAQNGPRNGSPGRDAFTSVFNRNNQSGVKFHQYFTSSFFIQKCFAKLFSNCSLALLIFGEIILVKKLLIKCWWNDHRKEPTSWLPCSDKTAWPISKSLTRTQWMQWGPWQEIYLMMKM